MIISKLKCKVACTVQKLHQIRLSNPHDLLALMAKHSNVQAVASGHAHQAFTKQHEDVSFYVTPSTCAQYKPRTKTSTLDELAPGYRIFEYAKGVLQTKVCRIKL